MGIIKYFRKKYWEAAIFRGGRRIPFTCDICHFSVPAETAIKHIIIFASKNRGEIFYETVRKSL